MKRPRGNVSIGLANWNVWNTNFQDLATKYFLVWDSSETDVFKGPNSKCKWHQCPMAGMKHQNNPCRSTQVVLLFCRFYFFCTANHLVPFSWKINCIDDARDDQRVDERKQTENPQLTNSPVEWSVGQRERANFNVVADGDWSPQCNYRAVYIKLMYDGSRCFSLWKFNKWLVKTLSGTELCP